MTTEAKSSENLFAGVKAAAAATSATAPAPKVAAPPVAPEVEPAIPQVSELDMLKNKARLMGIDFSNNIGIDALRAKVKAKLEGEAETAEQANQEVQTITKGAFVDPTIAAPVVKAEPVKTFRQTLYEREMKLIRLRITNLDPKKKDLPGEIVTFANEVLGAVRKYVPFGEVTETGYHVPYCIYKQLRDRQFLNIKVRKDSRGRQIVETGWAREFALEILDPLTTKDLAQLAATQAAAGAIDNG